jgi:apolipoprotein N-acyltransferase
MIRKPTLIDLGIAAGCGLLMAFALPIVIPFISRSEILSGGWLEPLALVGLVPLLHRLREASPRRAFGLGVLSGACYFLLSLYWLDVAMTTFGHMPRYLSFPVLFLLVGFLALFWGVAFWAAVRVRKFCGLDLWIVLPCVWVALEFLRNYVLTGFPWASLGHTQARTLWLAQLSSLGGVYLVAFVVVLSNTVLEALWSWWRRKEPLPRWGLIVWAGVLGLSSVYSAARLSGSTAPEGARRIRAAVVQGNLDEKVDLRGWGGQAFVFVRMLSQTQKAEAQGAELVVWPEGTLPGSVHPNTETFERMATHAELPEKAELIIGGVTRGLKDQKTLLTNSAFLTGPDLRIRARYDKRHLVPFGEYVPLESILPYEWFIPAGVAFFSPGPDHRPLDSSAGKLGMLICYEAIFPEVARETVNSGAQVLVNITNDSWYGFSSAPYQHLAIARMRAIETGRFMLRAANTGVSAIIDPRGRVLETIPLGLVPTTHDRAHPSELVPAGRLTRSVALLDGRTVYLIVGDLFAWLCSLAAVGLLGWSFLSARKQKS